MLIETKFPLQRDTRNSFCLWFCSISDFSSFCVLLIQSVDREWPMIRQSWPDQLWTLIDCPARFMWQLNSNFDNIDGWDLKLKAPKGLKTNIKIVVLLKDRSDFSIEIVYSQSLDGNIKADQKHFRLNIWRKSLCSTNSQIKQKFNPKSALDERWDLWNMKWLPQRF